MSIHLGFEKRTQYSIKNELPDQIFEEIENLRKNYFPNVTETKPLPILTDIEAALPSMGMIEDISLQEDTRSNF